MLISQNVTQSTTETTSPQCAYDNLNVFLFSVLGPSYCKITYWDGTVFHDVADGQGVDCINACHFWVEYSNGMMKVGKYGNEVPLMQGVGPTLDFTYFYVTSNEPIEWKIYDGCT